MTTRLLIATLLLAAMPVVGAAQTRPEPPKPARIVVNDSGGAMQSAMRRFFYDDFEKRYGIKVVNTSPVDAGKLRAMVETGNVEWTVTEIGGEDAIRAERSGLLERLDLGIIDLSRFPQHLQKREYVFPKSVYSTVMGYRSDIFKEGARPRNWADFWDVKRFPGPRTMQNAPVDNLEFALLADGVPADKLYPLDVDRAFKVMDRVKKDVSVWWNAGAQPPQLLKDNEVQYAVSYSGRVAGTPGIEYTYEQAALDLAYMVVPRGANKADKAAAMRLLREFSRPKAQLEAAQIISYTGPSPELPALLPKEKLAEYPTVQRDKQFMHNVKWWFENADMIEKRWQQFKLSL